MMSKNRLLFVLGFCVLLAACTDDATDDTITPTGDPTQAARAFMTAFLNGNVEGCLAFATAESRDSVETLCAERAAAEAHATLHDIAFEELERDGRYAFVEMRGTYQQRFTNPEDGRIVENEVSAPLVIVMYFQDNFWRFDDFATVE